MCFFVLLALVCFFLSTPSVCSLSLVQLTHVIDFPTVPYGLGIRNIHTPEHMGASHRLRLQGFHLVSTNFPARTGPSSHVVAFRLKSWFCGEQEARMFTDARDRSNVMVFGADERALFLVNLRVEPLGAQGHRLHMSTTLFAPELSFFARLLLPLLFDARSLEDALSWGYVIRREDRNLRCYRRRVLNTRDSPPSGDSFMSD